MRITYQVSPDDYRHALIAYRNRNFLSRWFLPLSVLFCVLLAIIEITLNQSSMRSFFPATVVAIGMLLFLQWGTPYLNARRQFRNTPSAHGEITLEVEEVGLHFRSANTDAAVSWKHYIKWIEDESVFVLFSSPLIFVLIPKRAFHDGQLPVFKETLREKIPARQ